MRASPLVASSGVTAERLLDGLDDDQRLAATITTGPLAILAGAGSGKTRVVTRRVAYAVATGAVDAGRVLLLTFTEKAAAEMVLRVGGLGLPPVTARTFHAAALAQLRHYWPLRHEGRPLPEVLADRYRLAAPLVRALPGGFRFTPVKDVLDEIGWAKARRVRPEGYAEAALKRTPPLPIDIFTSLYRAYERARKRADLIDFDDMLTLAVELLETDAEVSSQVRRRYSWFSVDEYQDTNPLQQRLLELWLGERRDLCVVGDEDQTIYTFAGATPAYLTGFAERFDDARVVSLLNNHRSSPQVLELANRLIAATGRSKRLSATRPPGPAPTIVAYADADAELAGLVAGIRALETAAVARHQMAVLVRLNAQVAPIEEALARAAIPHRVLGQRFFDRREVRAAVELLRRATDEGTPLPSLVARALALWKRELGFDPEAEASRGEARERQAALSTLLAIVEGVIRSGAGSPAGVVDELQRRAEAERTGAEDAVELLTLHRAKGLEWEAVFLPSLEEGLLPVGQATDDELALAEERRLLYVGITRARRHLALSWARARPSAQGRISQRRPSRFLADVAPARAPLPRPAGGNRRAPSDARRADPVAGVELARSPSQQKALAGDAGARAPEDPLMVALRAWRTARARTDGVPPYVVLWDATMVALAGARPTTPAGLLRVPGIGPAKAERYGHELLAIVSGSEDGHGNAR